MVKRQNAFLQTETLIDPDMDKEINDFKKENPNVRVYPYTWTGPYATWCFYYASLIITNFYYNNLKYITSEDFTIEFEKWKK